MPELPEVEALARFVTERATGRTVERVEPAALSALKTFEPPVEALLGCTVTGATRRGKYLIVMTDGPWMVVHLSRGGWLHWREKVPPARARPGKGPLALRVGLSDGSGFDLTEAGTEKRLSVWMVADPVEVPGVARLGPDPLADGLDAPGLAAVLAGRTGNLKTVLVDQSVLAGVGNAYSDEILHRARLSPYKSAARLSPDEAGRLHAALIGVLTEAVDRAADLPASGLKADKKSAMAVHGRTGLDCPVCGDTVREVSYATRSLQYCPTCQTGGRPLADRRLSRLLR